MILAGFSQGGAIVLPPACAMPRTLAGIIALSTYLPLDAAPPPSAARPTRDCRSSWATAVSIRWCRKRSAPMSRDAAGELGYDVEWHSYPMAHQVCPPEITELRAWIAKRLTASAG